MEKLVKVWQINQINYDKALKLQRHLVNLHHQNQDVDHQSSNTVLCLEHPPVYTTGIRNRSYPEGEEQRLRGLGADFYRTDRGGLITFHGPGQLVVYPILNLKQFKLGMKWYVCNIEKTVIDMCKKLGIEAETSPHTGVWINDHKVCAIGIHGSRYITSHGLAINCCTDLKWFENIIPCGIEDKGVTSLSKELNRHVGIDEIIPLFLTSFKKRFECDLVQFPNDDAKQILSNL